ncbi:hypothetical protein GH741_08610 [Aquibacillus halophilus]|uniref:RDD domain-containing protein n=1 Tax=Aquibacillus halophilus TaxID=930132 RepID=A0A6A8DAV4_9BACI|nr:RDD family protein [Aquibacillus halophilus]MRH42748.1 hypothetical protein [Aquibacillus halophilus]
MSKNERLEQWLKLCNENKYKSDHDESENNDSTVATSEKTHHHNKQKEAEQDQPFFVGFEKRLYAFVIDWILFSVLIIEIGNFPLLLFIYSLYYALLTSSPLKGTIGKLAVGAVVVDSDGNKISFTRALIRYYSYWISAAMFLFGFIMIAFDHQNRSLHDMICRTYVVDKQQLQERLSVL